VRRGIALIVAGLICLVLFFGLAFTPFALIAAVLALVLLTAGGFALSRSGSPKDPGTPRH
jgi:archaellin